jgi:hypothetical protein
MNRERGTGGQLNLHHPVNVALISDPSGLSQLRRNYKVVTHLLNVPASTM